MSIVSSEIRKIAVEAYLFAKATQQQIADILGFHRTAIVRRVREHRKDGKIVPQAREHMTKAFSDEEKELLAIIVEENQTLLWRKSKRHFQNNALWLQYIEN